jgi:putative tricarboxylic transport membrane protein
MTEPSQPPPTDRVVVGTRSVDVVVSLALLALAILLGWDSWRIGNSWASDGPQSGYFPFYLSLVMGLCAVYGLVSQLILRHPGPDGSDAGAFVTRDQLGRVMMVLIPTFAFCLATEYLGIYVASFVLVLGFMSIVGKIKPWICLLTAVIFVTLLFATFELAFHVIMPKGPLEAALGF